MIRPAALPIIVLAGLLTACTGYQLGGNKPSHLSGVRTIQVSLVRNSTLFPRAAAHATNAIADAIAQDGTYRVGTTDQADARLETTLSTINYQQVRSTREDSLRAEELEMTVVYEWTLVDAADPRHILERGRSVGTTSFFVDPNLQTARQNALPDALKRAADSMISSLADSF